MDKNLYDLPPGELKEVPTVCASLREALDSLMADHDFLLKGDVFSKDQIEAYIELKWDEVHRVEQTPSPVEYDLYYSEIERATCRERVCQHVYNSEGATSL